MRAVGIILAGGNNRKMHELTAKRAVAAMPIAGSYRAIDFALSNMTNSHIQKVAVLTQYTSGVSRAVCMCLHLRSLQTMVIGTEGLRTRSIRIWIS